MGSTRGFFEIGVWHGKTSTNIGTLWRSAHQLGASGIFTVGRRYRKQPSDTIKAWRSIPLRNYLTVDDMELPFDAMLVGVEMGGEPLSTFRHPKRCIYLLGAEDHGLAPDIVKRCHRMVSIESVRSQSFNVAVAGSLVMYDRLRKASA